MKKILIKESQLTEIGGVDFTYIDNDYIGQRGNIEITTSSDCGDLDFVQPLTTDEYASILSPQNYFGYRNSSYARPTLNNITENNKELENKLYTIPDKIFLQLKNNSKNSKGKGLKGIKRLNFLINNKSINLKEMYRLRKFFNECKDEIEFNLLGGDDMKQWIENQIEQSTEAIRNSKEIKKDIGIENSFIKTHTKSYGNMGKH